MPTQTSSGWWGITGCVRPSWRPRRQAAIWQFAEQVHAGQIVGCKGQPFRNVLVVGIGGSSLGPVFVSEALQSPADRLRLFFIDNTDPDGMDMVLGRLEPELAQKMVIVIS